MIQIDRTDPRRLVWFRSDLRIDDNKALSRACSGSCPVYALFFATPQQWREHDWGPRKLSFLWQHVLALSDNLNRLGIAFQILYHERFSDCIDGLVAFCRTNRISEVHVNAEYGINERRRDQDCQRSLRNIGVGWHTYHDATVLPPSSVLTKSATPFRVFTPFKRAWLNAVSRASIGCVPPPQRKLNSPKKVTSPFLPPDQVELDEHWWPIGEEAAHQRLQNFVDQCIHEYKSRRNFPAANATSKLSPYLALGVISVRRCVEAALHSNNGEWTGGSDGVQTWLNELIWREFYISVLHAFPRVSMNQPLRSETARLRWRDDAEALTRWQQGLTGFPLIDAGMRQLLKIGWMHNRARMVCAMFLAKYLLIDWRLGERWFMEQLVDGDLAANNGGWQWSASTGTDAAPYFRLLSPLRQAQRFDPAGDYIRQYVPELVRINGKSIHQPTSEQRRDAGYPDAIIELRDARQRCIAAFRGLAD